jgi:polyisoprenoid-binding protein YceI
MPDQRPVSLLNSLPFAPKSRQAVLLIISLATMLSPLSTAAQETVIALAPAQTRIDYSLGATAHTVHGTFKLKRGTVHFDPATGKASGSIVVDATSGTSGNDGRDSKMHHEILESPQYPEIVFTPAQVKGTVAAAGTSQVEVSGTFRLHGQDHEFSIPVAIQLAGSQATATTHFAIPYQKWGLKNPSTFILRVKDTVEMEVHATARVSPAATK